MARGLSRRLACGAALTLLLLTAACGNTARKSPAQPAPVTPQSGQSTPAPGTAGSGSTGTAGGATGASTAGDSETSYSNATLAGFYKADGSASVQAGQALKMEMTEFKFTPNTITASAGKPVVIALSNKGTTSHNLTIAAFKVDVTLPPGHATTVRFTPHKAGTYYFYCDIPGHVQAGMVGKLVVH